VEASSQAGGRCCGLGCRWRWRRLTDRNRLARCRSGVVATPGRNVRPSRAAVSRGEQPGIGQRPAVSGVAKADLIDVDGGGVLGRAPPGPPKGVRTTALAPGADRATTIASVSATATGAGVPNPKPDTTTAVIGFHVWPLSVVEYITSCDGEFGPV
jgi:hypothetical protein